MRANTSLLDAASGTVENSDAATFITMGSALCGAGAGASGNRGSTRPLLELTIAKSAMVICPLRLKSNGESMGAIWLLAARVAAMSAIVTAAAVGLLPVS